MKTLFYQTIGYLCLCGILSAGSLAVSAAQEEHFPTPEAAIQALTDAAKSKDHAALDKIFGPEVRALASHDPVQASNHFNAFTRRLSEGHLAKRVTDDRITLEIGYDNWPFAIPLVKQGNDWIFDTAAGREEILNRRIGADELGAIRVCHSYVDAQHEYASADRLGDGVMQYAQHLRSTDGKHDGLYWHVQPGEERSPFGPLISEAHDEGYHRAAKMMSNEESPYHGYYFKILTRQGRHAAGGKYNYVINGHMVAGFALVAWPAEWGNSGVMTFIVNQQGKVFERNLGPKTASLAAAMTAFEPDATWKPAWEP